MTAATRPHAPHDTPDRWFYSVEEAATALSLSKAEVFRLCAAGTLYSVKYKRRRLIPADALAAFARDLTGDALTGDPAAPDFAGGHR